jgi:hypothetical protein
LSTVKSSAADPDVWERIWYGSGSGSEATKIDIFYAFCAEKFYEYIKIHFLPTFISVIIKFKRNFNKIFLVRKSLYKVFMG